VLDRSRATPRPLITAVDDDRRSLDRIERALQRFGADYRVRGETGVDALLTTLEEAREREEPVALVLVSERLAGSLDHEVLARVRALHPNAKRALLVDWGAWADRETADAILRSIGLGHADYYVLRPWSEPDELFHRTVAEFIHEWTRLSGHGPRELRVVGDPGDQRAAELRSILTRNGVPHRFIPADSPAGEEILRESGAPPGRPVVVPFAAPVLVDPSNAQLAGAYGVATELGDRRSFDVVIVGAGPGGLAAAVYASSEGLETLVVEGEAIGGQAGTSSLIRNYLGFSRGVSGADLAQRGYQQAWVFGAQFLLMRQVTGLRGEEGDFTVELGGLGEVAARAVILGTGVSYRTLDVPGIERLTGSGVSYGASVSEAPMLRGRRVCIVGGGNSAGQAALHLSRYAAEVTLIVRADALTKGMSQYLCQQIHGSPVIDVRLGTEVAECHGDGRLERLTLREREDGALEDVPADALLVLIGAVPRTAWLPQGVARDDRGYVLTGRAVDASPEANASWPLANPPTPYETCVPGLYAVGDVRHGSVKRVASAVGEGSVVIQHVHERLTEAGERGRAAR
jgi:thioredoxin reductase (NADPH)